MVESAGIHHVTAISGDPQETVDFYAGLLGLRLVKKTVNFDDPETYHLYLGDERGRPGTIVTFFAWGRESQQGRAGVGQVTTLQLAVPPTSLPYWRERLKGQDVDVEEHTRFGETALAFHDPDGLGLELVGAEADPALAWTGGPVDEEHAIRGVHATTLTLIASDSTRQVLEDVLRYDAHAEEGARIRYAAAGDAPGRFVDLVEAPQQPFGVVARGTVHHVAFRASDAPAQATMRRRVEDLGLRATHVLDRNYFRSIYFREPGGVLFEIATDEPGFSVDEPVDRLGEHLKLPSWLEPRREHLEEALTPIRIPSKPRGVTA